jgi:hypothetical protein
MDVVHDSYDFPDAFVERHDDALSYRVRIVEQFFSESAVEQDYAV